MGKETKNKYDFLNLLLAEGDAMVCLDARQPDVDVPKAHKQNAMLNLVFNLSFRRPLEITEDGIYTTLSFGGRPHKCVIPFTAVWAIYDPETNKGEVWEESLPEDVDLAGEIIRTAVSPEPKKKNPLHVLTTASGNSKEAQPSKPKRDRSHLRVIK